MAFPLFLAFFVLLSPLLLVPSDSEQQGNQIQITCPNSFDCQKLGRLYFPLSNSTQCGLCTVTCDDEENPKIQLGNEGPSYDVVGKISQADDASSVQIQIQIHDPLLQDQLGQRKCGALGPNIRFPNSSTRFRNSSSISIKTLNDEITLFKCNRSSFDHFEGFHKYTNCPVPFDLYYYEENRKDQLQPSAPAGLNCSEILLSMKPPDLIPDPSDLFLLASADFTVELHVSAQCLDCHDRGGQCQDYDHTFECTAKVVAGRPKLGLILGTAIPCSFILMISVIIVFKHWNYVSSFFLSRNTSSSDPSPEVDLEWSSIFFGVPVFSYSELEDATNKFDLSKELGDGGFGTVYYGKLRDGREVAVKRLYEHNYKRVTQFMNEVDILTRLRHPNLVSLYGCTSRHSRELLLVYEYIPNGTVADHLFGDRDKYGSLPWSVRMDIAIETASALAYLHASGIIHRDVKTNNILLDNDFHVKVADFGLSRLFPTDVTHVSTAPQGTPGYVDPEYHQCYQLTDKSDVYSFGVVLIELVSSLPAVDINRHRHEINLADLAMNMIQNGAFNELIDASLGFQSDSEIERMTTSVAEVAFRCVQLEKEMRPTMEEVFETLKEIQGYKDEKIGKGLPPPPDGDHVVLLKNTVPSSPVSVTNRWVSSSNSSVSGG